MSAKETNSTSYFSRENLRFSISSLNYLPRWIVLAIDMGVLVAACLFSFLLFRGTGLTFIITPYWKEFIVFFLIMNIFSFWLFRTYSGIIRHSSYIDAVKLLFSQVSILVFFLLFNLLYELNFQEKAFLNTALFINTVFAFCGLFLYRVVVKRAFELYFSDNSKNKLVRTIIYGTDANAISVANALNFATPARFKVIGFVDHHNQNGSKRLLDLPILAQKKKLPALMRSIGAEGVIIADKSLTKEEQIHIVDQCLEFNYKVFTVPPITNWENQKEISQKIKNIQIEDLLERKPIVLDDKSISKQLKDKTVLITGAAGSIGSEIVRQVLTFNPKVVLMLDQAETPLHQLTLEIQQLETDTVIHSLIADVRSKKAMESVFATYQPQVVYHDRLPEVDRSQKQIPLLFYFAHRQSNYELQCQFLIVGFPMSIDAKAFRPDPTSKQL
jgi:FlaA1/EpsC-like NDP-sugar epimerase